MVFEGVIAFLFLRDLGGSGFFLWLLSGALGGVGLGPWSSGFLVPWSSGCLVVRSLVPWSCGCPAPSGLSVRLATGRPGRGPRTAALKKVAGGFSKLDIW